MSVDRQPSFTYGIIHMNSEGGSSMNIGERIYSLRKESDMSQGDLADKLNVSRQSVSKWENDNSTPDIEKLVLIAEIFGITVDELVKDETIENAEKPLSFNKSETNLQTSKYETINNPPKKSYKNKIRNIQ